MANKAQRDRDKKDQKKRPFSKKTEAKPASTAALAKAGEKQAKSAPRRLSSSLTQRPWARLVEIRPAKTHAGQANASARKKYLRGIS